MKDKNIVDLAVTGFVVLVVVPAVVGIAFSGMGHIVVGVGNVINRVKYNNKIKKGLKDGSIIEIDGKYFENFGAQAFEGFKLHLVEEA